ncbi:MAG: DUF4159 domain-containing protein [Myxococcales bacterium]|nr:DUF4159 domain-containing protein [Myxococcales bacterium]MCB9642100.1 DUF4159 domain-containing protein [Myxococcales bacterium]
MSLFSLENAKRLLGVLGLCWLVGGVVWLPRAAAMGKRTAVQMARLKLPGLVNNRPRALSNLLLRLTQRTSIKVSLDVPEVAPNDAQLFHFPVIVLTGKSGFSPLDAKEILRLRAYLTAGGLLWMDLSEGGKDSDFDRSARRLAKRLFPQSPMIKLPQSHTIYRSFYLIRRFGGRVLQNPYIEGVTLDDRTPIVYSMNDYTGAWERDMFGNWALAVIPGDDAQRENAFRIGINLLMYALCVNYKQDLVHAPAIMRRRR